MELIDLLRQFSILIRLPTVVLISIAAAFVVIPRDWRLALFAYAALSVMLALLLSQVVPSEWALLQAIVGGLIAVMCFLSARQLRSAGRSISTWEAQWPQMASLSSFRLMAVVLATVAFLALRGRVRLPELDRLLQDAVLWLVLIGLLGLALHEEPLHAGLALLTALGGLNLLLFPLIPRQMVIGLLGAEQLLIGLAVSYLVLSRGLAGSGEPSAYPRTSRWHA